MVCAHTDTVYKEWLIPPKYNGLPSTLLSTHNAGVSSKFLLPDQSSSVSTARGYHTVPSITRVEAAVWHFTFDSGTRRSQSVFFIQHVWVVYLFFCSPGCITCIL